MNHTESYAAAAFDHDTREDRMERKQAEIEALADELYEADLLSPERWADALADFAWWPPKAISRAPDPDLVQAIGALMLRDDLRFAEYCRAAIIRRIQDTAYECAEMRLSP